MNKGTGPKYIQCYCPRCGKQWKKRCKYPYTGRRFPAPFFCGDCATYAEKIGDDLYYAEADGRVKKKPMLV